MENLIKHEINSKTTAYSTKGEVSPVFQSLEYEISYLPSSKDARMIYQSYKDRIPPGTDLKHEVLLKLIREDLSEKHNFEIEDEEEPFMLEFHIPVATLSAHKVMYPRYVALLKDLKALGFTSSQMYAGIHANIDYSMFGSSRHEIYEAIKFFLEFAFYNPDFIIEYSRRELTAQDKASIFNFISDPFDSLDKQEQKRTLDSNISDIKKNLISNKAFISNFNMTFSKSKRNCIEIRWFNSTLNPIHLMSILEFFPAFMEFYSETPSYKLEDFCHLVKRNYTKYPNLHLDLLSNHYSYPYSVIGVANLNTV